MERFHLILNTGSSLQNAVCHTLIYKLVNPFNIMQSVQNHTLIFYQHVPHIAFDFNQGFMLECIEHLLYFYMNSLIFPQKIL